MNHGQQTAQAARALARQLAGLGLTVLYDHGQQGVDPPHSLGQIVSWTGPRYTQSACLAYLDIAVVRADTNQALALIEVEESVASPKLLLGDLLATLLGDHLSFKGRPLDVGPGTALIVLTPESTPAKRQQMAELARRVSAFQPALHTGNASIGQIVVDTYAEGALDHAVSRLVGQTVS